SGFAAEPTVNVGIQESGFAAEPTVSVGIQESGFAAEPTVNVGIQESGFSAEPTVNRRGETIFEQARNEIDSASVQMCYALLMVLWVGITYILLVYGMLIRKLMGSSTEKKVLEAWAITLVFDNLVLQMLKSLTIKLWIKWLIQKIKTVRAGEESLMLYFEDYINAKLPAGYQMAQSGAGDMEVEYDAAGMDF
ncbi:hypothetical protein CYMTET_17117, partial [Cymbomonas tetramitiformis]